MFTVLQVVQVPQLHVPLDVYPGVVRSLISKFASEDEGTRGIIFVGSLDRCDKLFDALVANVPSWECRFVKYHAGDTMTDQEKLKSLAAFHSRSLYPVVMIATTAAGASLDEPWVRFTLHDGIVYGDENLAQETGRAGAVHPICGWRDHEPISAAPGQGGQRPPRPRAPHAVAGGQDGLPAGGPADLWFRAQTRHW